MGNQQVKKTVCAFCGNFCGILVHVEDGKITNIEGNPKHPISRGFTCERNRLAVKWLYHPDQLMYPLKRRGLNDGGGYVLTEKGFARLDYFKERDEGKQGLEEQLEEQTERLAKLEKESQRLKEE